MKLFLNHLITINGHNFVLPPPFYYTFSTHNSSIKKVKLTIFGTKYVIRKSIDNVVHSALTFDLNSSLHINNAVSMADNYYSRSPETTMI